MSEYWVSKKKYFCKYCEIYIADDAPSRQHHENGFRHKGNVERFIRGIYKAGEKQKKDREEELRDMKRVELAAAAAFAQDISTGVAKPTKATTPSTSSAPKKPPQKSSNPYANYSTAASLGYTDPEAEKLAAEMKIRQTQGVAGNWQMVTPTFQQAESSSSAQLATKTAPTTVVASDVTGVKREAEGPPDEDDARSFKLRKKTLNTGLGDIYDPGLIPIKLKKKEEAQEPSSSTINAETSDGMSTSFPKRTKIQLVIKPDENLTTEGAVKPSNPSTSTSSKWTKAKWSEPLPDVPQADRALMFGPEETHPEPGQMEAKAEGPEMKVEAEGTNTLNNAILSGDSVGVGTMFKKRKAPGNAGRGRREV